MTSWAVAFLELAHSTGAEPRLARPGSTELAQKGHGFGSHSYGTEERTVQFRMAASVESVLSWVSGIFLTPCTR